MGEIVIHTGVITGETMFRPLLEVCPSFRPAWDAHRAEWADEPSPMCYLALGDLARHMVGLLERGETDCFAEVFAVVERWLVEGDAYVREAASIGFIEDLSNTGLYTTAHRRAFVPWLLPESLCWWREIIKAWEGDGVTD